MVAFDPFTGKQTEPTKVEIDRGKDGEKTVRYPNDPHVASTRHRAEDRPQTELSGYAQGGTTNPPEGQTSEPVWYSPEGEVEESAQPMFRRDREVNPKPYERLEGDTIGAVSTDGTAADTEPDKGKASKAKAAK